jgi:hemoglobin
MANELPPNVVTKPPPPGVAAGIDETMIERLVHGFYGRIRTDAVLGPIFTAQIEDWEPHLAKMCAFWSSMLLMTRRYDGRPVPAHLKIEGLGAAHFERWLDLFRATAHDLCPPEAAAPFIDRAERVAQSLQMSIDWQRGVLPPLKAPILAGKTPGSDCK